MTKIKFIGAAREVTGSMHLIEKDGFKLLIDCGMIQGKRKESFERNRNFQFAPYDINAMILTHAHIDHSGNIPTLINQGFKGNVYTSYATRDLCRLMLPDSAYVQLKDLEYVNKKRAKQGKALFEPLYSVEEAEASLEMFVPKNLGEQITFRQDLNAFFMNAGHILGSVMAVVRAHEKDREIKIGFTGDLGRKSLPIIMDPDQLRDIDYLVVESTYGGRDHKPIVQADQKLASIINETVSRRGKIIIPVFAVERAQEVLYVLNRLFIGKKIPPIPVFVDSPLTNNVTEVFKQHAECFDRDMLDFIAGNNNPFHLELIKYIESVEESKNINNYDKPCIILSATGMCEAGRILHHLKNNIENPNNTVLIVGYQTINTLGRRLVEGEKQVKIFGDPYTVQAQVKVINEFSGHAGQKELLRFIKIARDESGGRLKKIFLVHGEESQQQALLELLAAEGIKNVYNPEPGYEEIL
ncbi:MAG: MBL fold metallo-hydrolase [Spirochaetia bacterium]|nr:MBL fold metallo-hydrolase [Spirochaetia bacterium]